MADKKTKQKKEIQKLANGLKHIQISSSLDNKSSGNDGDGTVPLNKTPNNTILDRDINPELLSKWPKLKLRVPAIFLRTVVDFDEHLKRLLILDIKYKYRVTSGYFKISCQTFDDHKAMVQYFDKKQLPYHTFGHPLKRKMKVVIRGLPNDIDLKNIKDELKFVSVPVIRVHKMHTKQVRKDDTMLVLAVVPFDDNGQRILKVNQILGYKVALEPPISKLRQCYRCQQWGHSQRYCHEQIKCVKCGGNHLYKKCERDPNTEDPPKCANCGGHHTANYKKCSSYYDPSSNSEVSERIIYAIIG